MQTIPSIAGRYVTDVYTFVSLFLLRLLPSLLYTYNVKGSLVPLRTQEEMIQRVLHFFLQFETRIINFSTYFAIGLSCTKRHQRRVFLKMAIVEINCIS